MQVLLEEMANRVGQVLLVRVVVMAAQEMQVLGVSLVKLVLLEEQELLVLLVGPVVLGQLAEQVIQEQLDDLVSVAHWDGLGQLDLQEEMVQLAGQE